LTIAMTNPEQVLQSIPYRRDDEPPAATATLGWRYHHVGIPTDIPRDDEIYIAQYGMYVSGFSSSPYGVEWMRFELSLPPFVRPQMG